MPIMKASTATGRPHPQHGAAFGHVIELHDPVSENVRVVVGERVDAVPTGFRVVRSAAAAIMSSGDAIVS